MAVDLDRTLARLAGRQDGIVTRAQLAARGATVAEITRLLRTCRLHRVHRGIYHVGHAALSHRARLRAAVYAAGEAAALSHRSAAAHWGWLTWDGHPELTTPSRSFKKPPGLIIHRPRKPPRTTFHLGLPVTTPEQTLLDLASAVGTKSLQRALGEAEYQRRLDRDLLIELSRGRKGAAAIRELLGDSSAATHSALEDRFLSLIRSADLPTPSVNETYLGRRRDFHWPVERVIVETDGWAAHGRRDAFEDDRDRDLDLEARGVRTARVTQRQLQRKPLRVLVRVGALLLAHSAATSHQ